MYCQDLFTFTTYILVGIVHSGEGRKVEAINEICARGNYSFCPNSDQQAPAGNENSRDLPQPSQPPNSGLATPPSLPNVGEYCDKYKNHYKHFCKNSNATDERAAKFCPTYQDHCDVSASDSGSSPQEATEVPEVPPAKIQQLCSDNQALANQYCFRPQIPKQWQIKKGCDMYLKYCVASSGDQLQQQNKSMQDALKESIKPCDKFQNDYIGFCVQNSKPYNENVAEFCKNYKATCIPAQLPTADTLTGQRADASLSQPQVPAQPQTRPMGINNPLGAIGGNPWSMAGSPMNPTGSALPLGNPNVVSDPIGSLGGSPMGLQNPAMASQAAAPVEQAGNAPSGLAAHPLSVGQQTQVGNLAGFSKGTAVNPFGQVATGSSVLAGPVGVQSGRAVDFSGIPGLSQLGSLPGLGRRRRKRQLLQLLVWSSSH